MKVLYISMLSEQGSLQDEVTSSSSEGKDDTGAWFSSRLKEINFLDDYNVDYINIAQGDPLPDVDSNKYNYIILGGTFYDVDGIKEEVPRCEADNIKSEREWQKKLMLWLKNHRKRKISQPLFGICGGHQAMVVACDGVVTRRGNDIGTAAGSIPVTITDDGFKNPIFAKGLSQDLEDKTSTSLGLGCPKFHFGNGDHVTIIPENSIVLAKTDDSPALAIEYGNHCCWYSTQFHPESSHLIWQYWVKENVIKNRSIDDYVPEATSNGCYLLRNFLQSTATVAANVTAIDADVGV